VRREADRTKFRLIGIAVFLFLDAGRGDPDDLLDERRFVRPPNLRSIKSAPDSAAQR
jgi:hypothetical protein